MSAASALPLIAKKIHSPAKKSPRRRHSTGGQPGARRDAGVADVLIGIDQEECRDLGECYPVWHARASSTANTVPGLVMLVDRRGEVRVDTIGTKTIAGRSPACTSWRGDPARDTAATPIAPV